MTGRDRIGWLLLLAAAMALCVLELRPPPPAKAPLDRMSIRITVSADGSMRVEAPDGTDVALPSPPLDDRKRADRMLLPLRDELRRLDPSADPDRLFEIVVDPVVAYERILWVQGAAFGVGHPRVRRFAFSLSGARHEAVPFVWTDVNEQGPGTPIIPYRVPMAKVRLFRSRGDAGAPETIRAMAAIGDGALHGAHPNDEFRAWTPITPTRQAIWDWVRTQKNRDTELVGTVELDAADLSIPFGAVFEILCGFVDVGLLIDFRVD